MTERQRDDLRSARVAADGAKIAEARGEWRMAKALWGSAGDRYKAAGFGQPAEVCRQYQAMAAKRVA